MRDAIHPKWLSGTPRAALLAVAALVSGTLVAGCGGSSPNQGVATVRSASTSRSTGGGASSGSAGPNAGDPALAFAKCMRSNGVPNFPDPNAGGGFLFHAGAGIDPSSPVLEAAQAKCRNLMPGGGPPGPRATTTPYPGALARMVKVARCMRLHGFPEFPDPRTSVPSNLAGIRVISDIEGVILLFPSTIDEQSPAFTRAAAACAFPLHNH